MTKIFSIICGITNDFFIYLKGERELKKSKRKKSKRKERKGKMKAEEVFSSAPFPMAIVWFCGISTIECYLMLNPIYTYISNL